MATSLQDELIECADCATVFSFTVAERLFYAERGIKHPSRCPDCRASRRAERNSAVLQGVDGTNGPMLWSDGWGNYGGSPGVSGRKVGKGSLRMYAALCSSCGKSTEVPFEPRGGRPVYCRECFNQRRGR